MRNLLWYDKDRYLNTFMTLFEGAASRCSAGHYTIVIKELDLTGLTLKK